jgi:hypothetical protein
MCVSTVEYCRHMGIADTVVSRVDTVGRCVENHGAIHILYIYSIYIYI